MEAGEQGDGNCHCGALITCPIHDKTQRRRAAQGQTHGPHARYVPVSLPKLGSHSCGVPPSPSIPIQLLLGLWATPLSPLPASVPLESPLAQALVGSRKLLELDQPVRRHQWTLFFRGVKSGTRGGQHYIIVPKLEIMPFLAGLRGSEPQHNQLSANFPVLSRHLVFVSSCRSHGTLSFTHVGLLV